MVIIQFLLILSYVFLNKKKKKKKKTQYSKNEEKVQSINRK